MIKSCSQRQKLLLLSEIYVYDSSCSSVCLLNLLACHASQAMKRSQGCFLFLFPVVLSLPHWHPPPDCQQTFQKAHKQFSDGNQAMEKTTTHGPISCCAFFFPCGPDFCGSFQKGSSCPIPFWFFLPYPIFAKTHYVSLSCK